MNIKTTYEWVLETLEDGDVVDAIHADRLASLQPSTGEWAIALVRQTHCTIDGDLLDRQYAYLENGSLPEYFENTLFRVPKKYHAEAARN